MKLPRISNSIYKKLIFLILFFYGEVFFSQPILPKKELTVLASQQLYFGLFFDYNGSGGTISIDWQGNRTSTGSIVLLPHYPGTPAFFAVKLCQGRNVIITYAPSVYLTATNGETMRLDIGPTEKGVSGAVFASENNCNFTTILRVGGTLHIPSNSNPSILNGDFEISFNQQ